MMSYKWAVASPSYPLISNWIVGEILNITFFVKTRLETGEIEHLAHHKWISDILFNWNPMRIYSLSLGLGGKTFVIRRIVGCEFVLFQPFIAMIAQCIHYCGTMGMWLGRGGAGLVCIKYNTFCGELCKLSRWATWIPHISIINEGLSPLGI